jgi:hypothetical protein
VWRLLLGLPPLVAKVAVVSAAMPTGVNPYLIATRFGTGQALASNTMTMTTAARADRPRSGCGRGGRVRLSRRGTQARHCRWVTGNDM